MAAKKSFLFIPDISGFTKFVKQTEIQHSGHIISELLEILIDSDELDMTVSEIEGDAILFYINDEVPSIDKIIRQTRKMFINFHNHLRYYETRRVCNCGACCTAAQLELKIVAHSGDLGFINVKNKRKPHGHEVILVHRLLKNSIAEKEYLLMTDALIKNEEELSLKKIDLKKGSTNYDGLGEINYKYLLLNTFKNDIKDPEPFKGYKKIANPLKYEGHIKSDIKNVFEIISNLDIRLTWSEGIDKLKYKKNRVNRVGTKHTCIINGKNIEFETVTNDFGQDRMVYGERVVTIPIVKEFTVYNILEKENDGTRLRFEVHYIPLPLIGWALIPIFKRLFRKNIKSTFISVKKVCESVKKELK